MILKRLLLAYWHLGGSVVLLGVNDIATLHLRVLDFNLRIVEDKIVVVDVFNYFDWLLRLLLWL